MPRLGAVGRLPPCAGRSAARRPQRRYRVAAEQPESGSASGSLPLARTGSSPVSAFPLKPSDHAAAGEGQGLSEKPVNFRSRCKKRLVAFAHRRSPQQTGSGAPGLQAKSRGKTETGLRAMDHPILQGLAGGGVPEDTSKGDRTEFAASFRRLQEGMGPSDPNGTHGSP
ncbi:hypothetical protein MC885_017271 [Smutsia gigantea]|nr:hypothetical protein MC885_017271 [Smutsia gigantea]